jgi:hypothetical protein
MNAPSQPNYPAHWQRRAEEARCGADRLADPEVKRAMLEIADAYERLAALTSSKK